MTVALFIPMDNLPSKADDFGLWVALLATLVFGLLYALNVLQP